MRNVSYRTTSRLACDCNSSVVLCVAASLTLDGSGFMAATVSYSTKSATGYGCNCATNCGCGTNVSEIYNYFITYDEALLADPAYSLISLDITGVLCGDCLLAYINYIAGHPPIPANPNILARAIINVPASQTDYSIIMGSGTQVITVYQLLLLEGASATDVTFNTKGSDAGTPITPTFPNDARGGFALPYSPGGWMETLPGESLTITTGSGDVTVGLIGYRKV